MNFKVGKNHRILDSNGKTVKYDPKSPRVLYLKSYSSIVAKIDTKKKITLYKDWDYSTTTKKHLYDFTGLGICTLRAMIESGEVKFENKYKIL